MDSNRFDEIARGLAKRASRRSMIKGIGATAVGAAIGLGGRRADAKSTKVGICHVTGAGSFNYISVSENAVPAHLAHGDAVTDLTDVDNCGACGNACSAPENATASCSEGSCGFACDAGYQVNEAGDACVTTSLCPPGYDPVNGACFQIVADLNAALCDNQCQVYGSVSDSFNFLCGTRVAGTFCNSNVDCASGDACYGSSGHYCIQAC